MNRHKFNRAFLRILGIDAVLVLKMIPALRLPAGGRNLSWSSTVLKLTPALRLPAGGRNLLWSFIVVKVMTALRLPARGRNLSWSSTVLKMMPALRLLADERKFISVFHSVEVDASTAFARGKNNLS